MIRSKIVVDKATYLNVKERIYADPKAFEAIQQTKAITKKYRRPAIILGVLGFLVAMVVWIIYFTKDKSPATDGDVSPLSIFTFYLLVVAEGFIPCALVAFLIITAIEKPGKKQGKELVRNHVFPLILNSLFKDEIKYYEKGEIYDTKYLMSLGYFDGHNLSPAEALIGKCLGVPFSCEDICMYDEGGNGDADTSQFFGTIIRLRYNKPSKSPIIIANKIRTRSGLKAVEGPKVELESPEFTKKFYVVGKDKTEVFRILTPDVQYRFEEVGKLTDAPAIFKIDGDYIEIVFGGLYDPILKIGGVFNEDKDLPRMIKGFIFIESLIKTLGLNNTYWLDIDKKKEELEKGGDIKEDNKDVQENAQSKQE